MFVSHEKDVSKKTFQKPNILRRKPKVSTARSVKSSLKESLGTRVVTSALVDTPTPAVAENHTEINADLYHKQTIAKSVLKLTIANNNVEENNVIKSEETDIDANGDSSTVCSNIIQMSNFDRSFEHSSINVESFLNGAESGGQTMPLSDIDVIVAPEQKITQAKPKWNFDLANNPVDIMITNYDMPAVVGNMEEKTEFIIDLVPSVISTSVDQPSKQLHEVICSTTPTRTVSVELISNKAVKFKCDEPNCSKGFWSEERLRKHKNSHNRAAAGRPAAPAPASFECPVRSTAAGADQRCPRTFAARRDLLKHLDAEHEPDDAPHRCEVCGRRFFWASGLRAHAQSVCARGGLQCAWPGCGRVFRLPCRLREHARAHTGDRPYRCRYPDCGWAFRSASKLVRHARRHTDERRHVCGACGRAFLRREHLRDHAARHHAPHARPTHRCPHAGCEQTFTNMSTLYMHMKKVHRKEEVEGVPGGDGDSQTARVADVSDGIYVVGAAGAGAGAEARTHAARTHCTWPLERVRTESQQQQQQQQLQLQHAFVLEDDPHAEHAEGAGSHVYTVRSDLFLHGNAPLDEDSQNMGGAAGGAAAQGEPDLCLIDAHPTIDLMQDELMYEDAAVDESSFRVLLMSEELA